MGSPPTITHSIPPKPGLAQAVVGALRTLWNHARRQPLVAALALASLLVIAYFYGGVHSFGPRHAFSALSWLVSTWNSRTGYEHGFLVPFLFIFLVARRLPDVLAAPVRPSGYGLILVVIGALFFVAAVRTFQPRVALAGLPLILLGGLAWWRGWAAARLLAFPVFLLYFVIPVPGMIQATNGLQLLATKSAYHLSKLFGMNASLSGNDIFSVPVDKWNFNIAEGCSGVRSLMALILVSAVYAHLTQKTLWKKFVLFACSVPLAILSNCLRVASILIVAEYFSAEFAAKTYHEGSGFLFFLVVGLAGLAAVDWLLNHRGRRNVVTRSTPAVTDGERSGRPARHAVSQGRHGPNRHPACPPSPIVPHGPPPRHPAGRPARHAVARVHAASLRGGARRRHPDGAAGKPVVLEPDGAGRPDRISSTGTGRRCRSARRSTGCWPATPNSPKNATSSPTWTPSSRSSPIPRLAAIRRTAGGAGVDRAFRA